MNPTPPSPLRALPDPGQPADPAPSGATADPLDADQQAMLLSAHAFALKAHDGGHPAASSGEQAAHRIAQAILRLRDDLTRIDPGLARGAGNLLLLTAALGHDPALDKMLRHAATGSSARPGFKPRRK